MLCACARDRQPEPRVPMFIVADVIVAVDNRSARPMLIYLSAGTREHALGTVPGRSSRSFSLPGGTGDSASTLQLEARERVALPGVRSQYFHVASGQLVTWTLDQSGNGTVTMR